MASAKHELMSRLIPPEQQGTELGNVNAAGQSANDSPASNQPRPIVKPGKSCRRGHIKCNCALKNDIICLKMTQLTEPQPQNKLLTTSNA